MDITDALGAFSALSHRTRLDIFRLLIKAGPDGMPAGAVAEAVGGLQNTVSSHLGALARAGLVESDRNGRSILYRANLDTVRGLIAYLLEDCCGGHPDVCTPLVADLSCLQPQETEPCCD